MAASMGRHNGKGGQARGGKAAMAAKQSHPSTKSAVDGGDDDSDNDDEEEEDNDGESGEKQRRPRERRKIKTKCWYINPRYFVDVVRFRLHMMRRHLERLESFQGGEAMFRCSSGSRSCSFECTLLEAQQRRTAQSTAGPRSVPANGVESLGVDQGSAAVLPAGFTCPLCGSVLSAVRSTQVGRACRL